MTAPETQTPTCGTPPAERIPVFATPHDWEAIDEAARRHGAAIVSGLIPPDVIERFNRETDAWIAANAGRLAPDTGSERYDLFLGRRTLRIHALPAKIEASHDLVTHPDLLGCVERLLSHWSNGALLSAAEVIQIGPGESSQILHRDTGSWWPHLERGEHPWNVSAMIALTPFTEQNGATRVVPGSHDWPLERRPHPSRILRAVMEPGDVLFFRGDVLHGGGANRTADQARRGVTLSYCAGWLRPVDNIMLAVPPHKAAELPDELLALLGYTAHDSTHIRGGLVGTYDYTDPLRALRSGELR
uniref:Phytanoyl-CoA dioxygenase n=1 Tax=Streptomyces sp. TP-A0584 TaxID=314563 RepID=A0A6S4QAU0_9ACTN|nr:phytanoyl-CoA dioxygenase [Streptomyces sp. TP-A0584]